jgi:hypothetical protein
VLRRVGPRAGHVAIALQVEVPVEQARGLQPPEHRVLADHRRAGGGLGRGLAVELDEPRDAGGHVLGGRPADRGGDDARLLARAAPLEIGLGQADQTREFPLRFLQASLRLRELCP